MKRLVCRKCGSSLFKFRRSQSPFQCYKCKKSIEIIDIDGKNNNRVDYMSITWKNVSN